MKLLLLITIAIASVLCSNEVLSGQARTQSPPTPFEDVGACPFEGCTYREWTAKETVAIRAARRTSELAFTVKAGEKVTALTGVVVTLRPGRVQFRERTTLRSASGSVQVVPGETLYLLTYQGEGFTKAWLRGQLLTDVDTSQFMNSVCDAQPSRCVGKVLEESRTEWWVQVRNRSGTVGWTREPEKFDGKDALSGLSSKSPPGAANDERAIKTLMAQTTEAFNSHDAKAWTRFCTPDARLVTVRGESMNGIAAIEKGLAAIFETRGSKARLETLDVAVRFLRPDVALAYVTNEMSGVTSPNGEQQPPHTELSVRVLVKDQGTWRITAFHNTIVQK